MKLSEKFQQQLEQTLIPISQKFGQNRVLQAITNGMVMTLPVTLGAAFFAILATFPVKSVTEFFIQIGIEDSLTAIVNGTTSVLALLISFTIAFSYANLHKEKGATAGIYGLTSFLILTPQIVGEGEQAVSAFTISSLGSEGILVAMLVSILVGLLYVKLVQSGKFSLRLPESVPTMVSDSLSPFFIGLIIYLLMFVIRVGFSFTDFGTVGLFINDIIAKPLMNIGGSVPAIIFVFTLSNMLFLFGIHPAAVQSVIMAVIIPMMIQNNEVFLAGETIPNLANLAVFAFANNDAAGATLSLMAVGLLFGKSKRYREFFKISAIPNLFNINEPVIFGMPIVLNPVMFLPFMLTSVVSGTVAWLAVKIGFITNYNPLVGLGMPFTVPKFIAHFFTIGWQGFVVWVINFLLIMALYYPFFKVLDNQALREESEELKHV